MHTFGIIKNIGVHSMLQGETGLTNIDLALNLRFGAGCYCDLSQDGWR